jgi:hypothetical protein
MAGDETTDRGPADDEKAFSKAPDFTVLSVWINTDCLSIRPA